MEISVSREAFVFLYFCLAGALLFFIYDLFRFIRKKARSGMLMVHVQDGLFWCVAFCILFFFVLSVNNGILRFYELLGVVLGAILYIGTLSPLMLRFLEIIFTIFSKIFAFFLKILLTPLLFTYNIIYRCLCFILLPLKNLGKTGLRRFLLAHKRAGRFLKKK